MIIPVRCFSCGKLISDVFEEYVKRIQSKQEKPDKVLDDLGITRYCCRRTIFSHVESIDDIMKYKI